MFLPNRIANYLKRTVRSSWAVLTNQAGSGNGFMRATRNPQSSLCAAKGWLYDMIIPRYNRGNFMHEVPFVGNFKEEKAMCIAVWIWQSHPHYPLLLLLNRDEYHNRPTKPVAWWEDSSQILGGRDCLAGGTWLACTRDGRLALLTNVMEPDQTPKAKSRGELPVRFLESEKSPLEFAEEVVKEGDQYNGFNLILADICSKVMIYVSNRPKGEPISIQEVSPGLHVLSNAKLDTPWHKAQRLSQNFNELLCKYGEEEVPAEEMVEQLMTDTLRADKEQLPNTGCNSEWELILSSIFFGVDTPLGRYGTRSMAALSVKESGEVSFYERYLEENIWNKHTVQYQIEKVQ